MQIVLSPTALPPYDTPPIIDGDVVTYRGASYDLSPLVAGAEIHIGNPFIGPVARVNGEIQCMLEYRYSRETAEDVQSTDWADFTFTVVDGQCPCPIKRKPEPGAAAEVADE